MLEVGLIVGMLVVVGIVVRWSRNRTPQVPAPLPDELPEATARATALIDATTSTDSGSVPPEERTKPSKSSRDEREKWLRTRAKLMRCRYCEERAAMQYPQLHPVTSVFDELFRYFNATPNRRWKISLKHTVGVPFELCARHHEQILGFFEETIASERQSYTRFVSETRAKMYEFERYGADERALEEVLALRGDKKRAPSKRSEGKTDGKVLSFSRNRAANGAE